MRDIVFNYKRDQLSQHTLDQWAGNLTGQLIHELRRSPEGLAIRYPAWVYDRLAELVPARFTIINVMGTSDTSTLRHLQRRELVTLWLVERLAAASRVFALALLDKQVRVTVKDNSKLLRVEIGWDISKIVLHSQI